MKKNKTPNNPDNSAEGLPPAPASTVTPLLRDANGNPTAFVHVPYVVTEGGTSRVQNVQVALNAVTDEEFTAAARMVRGEAEKLTKE